MAASFPYTHYVCPCSYLTSVPLPSPNRRASYQPAAFQLDEDHAFDSHSSRADYALYPLEHLLYCDECDAIRCARCWTEEVLYWYCPSCLFEVPSSTVRNDGNRCSRSCYNCPSCTSPLAVVQGSEGRRDELLKPGDGPGTNETYTLQCQYCDWNSLEIGVEFNSPTKITEQMGKKRNARDATNLDADVSSSICTSHEEAFNNLTTFYRDQLSESGAPQNPYSTSPYSSPANLARIMSLYGGLSHDALKKTRKRPQPMREALNESEGLSTFTASNSDHDTIRKMRFLDWEGTSSSSQRYSVPLNNEARFTAQLWPAATPLRTRRGRRCRTCRQFLTRPDSKVGSTRYKIRLLALNYIPRLSIRPLSTSPTPQNTSVNLIRPDPPPPDLVQPNQTKQYILTLRNPLFEAVKITLASPSTTPGPVASKVTILCPSFTLGPAGDLWDDALASTATPPADGGPKAAMASLTGATSSTTEPRQPEAGKFWEKTRSSTSVVVEIVPGSRSGQAVLLAEQDEEDDDVLEVPIFVRAEWEVDGKAGESGASGGRGRDLEKRKEAGEERVKKELGFWAVLGVGRIALDGAVD